MDFNIYMKESAETAVYSWLVYLFLGLCGEVGELIEKCDTPHPAQEVAKEAGDVLWYCAAILRDLNLMPRLCTAPTHQSWLPIFAGRIAERAKKAYRDNGGEFTVEAKDEIAAMVSHIVVSIESLGIRMGYSLEKIMEINLQKLRDRKKRQALQGDGDNR